MTHFIEFIYLIYSPCGTIIWKIVLKIIDTY